MAIVTITNTRQKIASLRPANTDEAQLYVFPASTEGDGVLRVCSQHTSTVKYRIAHCTAGHGDVAADGDDWIAYDVELIAGDPPHEYSIHGNATETIRIKADTADKISFHFSGNLKVTS